MHLSCIPPCAQILALYFVAFPMMLSLFRLKDQIAIIVFAPFVSDQWAKTIMANLVLQAKKGQNQWKGEKIQSHNLCARWNAGERHKLLGNLCPSSAKDER